MPWTHAEYEQLKGRIWRQGQASQSIDVYIIKTRAEIGGEEWSWCESRLNRIRYKETLADAAVDGKLPRGELRSPEQVTQDLLRWRRRLESRKLASVERRRIVVPLPQSRIPAAVASFGRRGYSDFSHMNNLWNRSKSSTVHERLACDPAEWELYHTHYRHAREDWDVVPHEHVIKWAEERKDRDYVIGDFGCGEGELGRAISQWHKVHNFDHVAINDLVLECDMAHTGLEDASLDVAVFNLSLMGSNFTDYLREAHRTLKIDGELRIIEPASRFSDTDAPEQAATFKKGLRRLGYANIDVAEVGQEPRFLEITAFKKHAVSLFEGISVSF